MSLFDWGISALATILCALLWDKFIWIIPAQLRVAREKAMVKLSKNLLSLNGDVFANGIIRRGSILHDSYYKFLLRVLCSCPRMLKLKGLIAKLKRS